MTTTDPAAGAPASVAETLASLDDNLESFLTSHREAIAAARLEAAKAGEAFAELSTRPTTAEHEALAKQKAELELDLSTARLQLKENETELATAGRTIQKLTAELADARVKADADAELLRSVEARQAGFIAHLEAARQALSALDSDAAAFPAPAARDAASEVSAPAPAAEPAPAPEPAALSGLEDLPGLDDLDPFAGPAIGTFRPATVTLPDLGHDEVAGDPQPHEDPEDPFALDGLVPAAVPAAEQDPFAFMDLPGTAHQEAGAGVR